MSEWKLGTWKLFKYKQMTTKLSQEEYDLDIVNKSDLGPRQADTAFPH